MVRKLGKGGGAPPDFIGRGGGRESRGHPPFPFFLKRPFQYSSFFKSMICKSDWLGNVGLSFIPAIAIVPPRHTARSLF